MLLHILLFMCAHLTDTYPTDARRQKEHDDKPFKVKVVSPPPEELLPGTHFACFTSTKVQILTPEENRYGVDQASATS